MQAEFEEAERLMGNPKKPNMLAVLNFFEKNLIQRLLGDYYESWDTLFVDYEKPHVERVWRQCGIFRLNLHKIHACEADEALFHPHPWPSAMHVLSGTYETAIGHSANGGTPVFDLKGVVSGDLIYEMTEKNSWHYVRPIERPAYTVMLTGPLYRNVDAKRVGHKSTAALRKLSIHEMVGIITSAWNHYTGDANQAVK